MTYAETFPIDVRLLFVDPDMFESSGAFRKAGFRLVDRSSPDKIMVGAHEAAPGYFFKKYRNARRLDEQLENYQTRIAGARALHTHIAARGLSRVTVPRKWLHELPAAFAQRRKEKLLPSHVLIVDRLQIMDKHATEREYGDIDEQTLRELCVAVARFPGLDSTPKNVPFTEDGRIAFIDTESWAGHREREPLKYIRAHLSPKRWKQAREIFEELTGSDGDFEREEDTSSSSSSSS